MNESNHHHNIIKEEERQDDEKKETTAEDKEVFHIVVVRDLPQKRKVVRVGVKDLVLKRCSMVVT